jgi:hypothetical protein
MYCEKVLVVVNPTGSLDRYFVIREDDALGKSDDFIRATAYEINMPEAKLESLIKEFQSSFKEQALLVSLDQKRAFLSPITENGEIEIPRGARLARFSRLPYPVQGAPQKYWSVYERYVFTDPLLMEQLGYESDTKKFKILQRWDIRRYAEFEPIPSVAEFKLTTMPTHLLVWFYIFGLETKDRFNFYYEEVKLELEKRLVDIQSLGIGQDINWLDESFCVQDLGFWELDARRLRLNKAVGKIKNLWSTVDPESSEQLKRFTRTVKTLVKDLDLALDLYAYFGFGAPLSNYQEREELGRCLAGVWSGFWSRPADWTYETNDEKSEINQITSNTRELN